MGEAGIDVFFNVEEKQRRARSSIGPRLREDAWKEVVGMIIP